MSSDATKQHLEGTQNIALGRALHLQEKMRMCVSFVIGMRAWNEATITLHCMLSRALLGDDHGRGFNDRVGLDYAAVGR